MKNQQNKPTTPKPETPTPNATERIHPAFREDKWLMASMLQKAIRRGRKEDAVAAGFWLALHEPLYFMKRIGVIMIEDIGVSRPEVMATMLMEYQSNLGSPTDLMMYAVGLPEGVKSRLLCDLYYITESHPLMQTKDGHWSREAVIQRIPQLASFPLIERARMCQAITQAQLPKLLTTPYTDDYYDDLLPNVPKQMQLAMHIGVEKMEKMLPAAWGMKPVQTVTNTLPEPIYYGGVPEYAFDQHTRLGLRAIRELMTTHRPIGWPRHGGQLGIIKNLLFYLESGLLDQEVKFEHHDEVQRLVLEASVEHPDNFRNIERWLDVMREMLPTLHTLREDHILPAITSTYGSQKNG
jgi:hypothetical protein